MDGPDTSRHQERRIGLRADFTRDHASFVRSQGGALDVLCRGCVCSDVELSAKPSNPRVDDEHILRRLDSQLGGIVSSGGQRDDGVYEWDRGDGIEWVYAWTYGLWYILGGWIRCFCPTA